MSDSEPVESYSSRAQSKLAVLKSYAFYIAIGIILAFFLAGSFILHEVLDYLSPKKPTGTVYFAVIGDYGRNGAFNQTEVAQALAAWCKKTPSGKCDLIVGTGDNFYPNGVSKVNDALFTTSYENIYNLTSLRSSVFYQALGNHDYRGNVQAQIAYSTYHASLKDRKTPLFKLPGRFYDFVVEQGSTKIHFVVADTTPMTSQYDKSGITNQTELQIAKTQLASQFQFINTTLAKYPYKKANTVSAANAVDYKFLVGHHPIFGGADAERITNSQVPMQKVLKPYIDAAKVTAYLAGHNHNLEYLRENEKSPAYIVSGAGSESEEAVKTAEQVKAVGQSGFAFFVASPTGVKVSFVNLYGKEVETFTLAHN